MKNILDFGQEIIDEILENTSLITTDTRDLVGKKYFICFQGLSYDAHDFVEEIIKNPDIDYIFVEKDLGLNSKKIFQVESTLKFYQFLAQHYRKKIKPIVIAITGSAGKTTTKNLFKLVLNNKFKCFSTEKNFNNEYGVPKTILAMPKDTQVLVLELAMRNLGEIRDLSLIAEPNIALITNIGSAHIEILKSKENIRKAKLEILEGFSNLNHKNMFFAEQEILDFVINDEFYKSLVSKLNIELKTLILPSLSGSHNFLCSEGLLHDMSLVKSVSLSLGMQEQEIENCFQDFSPSNGRGNFIHLENDILFIDETYNSNPEAVLNSVEAIKKQFSHKKIILALGQIKESDSILVDNLFDTFSKDQSLTLLDLRELNLLQAKNKLDEVLESNAVVLFKASRAHKLEELIALYQK